jgi:hypothetical protein
VAIEGFDAREQLAVVAHIDEDLAVVANCALEEGKGTDAKFVFFDLRELILAASRQYSSPQPLEQPSDHTREL